MTGRWQLVAMPFTLALLVGAAFSSTSHTAGCDDAPAEDAEPDYGAMFGPQTRTHIHHGLQRRFARDVQEGLLSLSVFLVPGSDVLVSTPTVLTKVDDELVKFPASDLVIDENKWYLVARLDPQNNVRVLSLIVDTPPLEGAFLKVRNRDRFEFDGSEPSMAVYELSEDVVVPRTMTLSYHLVGYFEL